MSQEAQTVKPPQLLTLVVKNGGVYSLHCSDSAIDVTIIDMDNQEISNEVPTYMTIEQQSAKINLYDIAWEEGEHTHD